MKHFPVILALLALLFGPQARAQYAVRADSSAVAASAFRSSDLIAPGALIAVGVGIHCFAHEAVDVPVNDWFQDKWRAGRPELDFDNYLRHVPLVMDLGLGLVGARAKHGFVDRVIEASVASLALGVISGGLKELIYSPRPNGHDAKSFPSGHTDWVFMGAELVRMEYGWGWGVPAYLLATTVAVMRNYNNWHWMSDVIFAAGVGILTARIGGWLLEPTKRWLHIRTTDWGSGRPAVQASFAPRVDPVSGAFCAGLAFNF